MRGMFHSSAYKRAHQCAYSDNNWTWQNGRIRK